MSWRILALCAAACLLRGAPAREIAVTGATLSQFEDGPGVPPGFAFLSGDTVFLSFQISGYRVSEKDRIQLSYQVEAVDSSGRLLAPPVSRRIEAELAEEDKKWMPKARYEVLVPPLADSGAYRIRIRVKDELSGSAATAEVPFTVRGRAVEPSDTLVIRNFRFLRGEEDGPGLLLPNYKPGDAVWARFEITGYKLAENNRHHVDYGVAVLRPTGEVLYSEPNAASEQDESFYPKRYVLGILSLKLDPDIAKGDYVIVVDARDRLGNQKTESRYTFRVE